MALFNTNKKETTNNLYSNENIPLIAIDLAEDEEFYYLYSEIPGRELSDIKLKFKGEKLSLRVSENEKSPVENKDLIISERYHDERERMIEFECPVDKKEISAIYKNGLLEVVIKKTDPDDEDDEDLIKIIG